MPTYVYRCRKCGSVEETFQPITAEPLSTCSSCGEDALVRVISGGAGFLFKGSGFYLTDYRSESYKKAERAEKSAASGVSSPGKDGKKEVKKETTKASE